MSGLPSRRLGDASSMRGYAPSAAARLVSVSTGLAAFLAGQAADQGSWSFDGTSSLALGPAGTVASVAAG
jgi:hypothetical protein